MKNKTLLLILGRGEKLEGFISIIFSTKAIFLGSIKKKLTNNNLIKSEFRSSIIDRNNNLIAKTVISYNVGINPNLVIDKINFSLAFISDFSSLLSLPLVFFFES